MIRDIKIHKKAYAVLAFALFGFILLFMHLWPNRMQQKLVAVALGAFYFVWGVVVHRHNNHINSKVVFEYLAAATLGVSLLLLMLN